MKLIKLCTHQKSFSTEDLIINPKEHPDIKIGDIVEIYHPDEEGFRLLLQVNDNKDKSGNLTGKDTISVESNIATTFNLRTYANVVIQVVKPSTVALDSVEITFKDQYMGRSEMWRLKSFLTNTCVYLNKKIEYCMGSIRCQVYEMWSQGDRVACGVINEDTKVVFRSSTSMVYLFIQMSSEMWDFDIHGDLYFEKAVNGFLTDLFMKWKKLGSNHEVTIVLFSRTFYNAKSLDEFPAYMQECLHMDHKGRFYEDFYRVAIQNERYDDWSTILVQLRRLFTAYHGIVLRYHERGDLMTYIPNAMNSTAAQGNFLEVLNISLNVFEKHYLDRSFERTGQLSVVITPGVGVFEVDRELTNITKQRIIDNGVGSDLVCVGEQPLHAVPLLKFHNKDASLNAADDYSMPHWINLSFYSTNKKVAYSTFIPRIKLPPLLTNEKKTDVEEHNRIKLVNDTQKNEYIHNSLFDYDAYDAEIFSLPSAHGTCSLQRAPRTKKTSVPSLEGFGTFTSKEWENITPSIQIRRKMSDPDIHHGTKNVLASSQNNSPKISEAMSILEKQNQQKNLKHIGGTIVRPGRALINPFDPSHVTIKLTSNRRRWTHIFPKGPTGVLIQQHHYQAVPTTTVNKSSVSGSAMSVMPNRDPSDYQHTSTCKLLGNGLKLDIGIANAFGEVVVGKRKISILHSPAGPNVTVTPSKSLTLLWGATGEQEWTPALTTGVDWKSLTIPACLPITTDYFPDNRSLNNDYVVSDYTLLPEDVNADYAHNRGIYKKPLSTEEVFKELVSQRLAQGFQVIVVPDKSPAVNTPQMMKAPCCGGLLHKNQLLPKQKTSILASMAMAAASSEPHHKEYLLSIGRIFHRITLSGSVITVTRYRPRHPYTPLNIDYRYRFQAPQHDTYEVSGVNFTTEKLENFNWNYMDQYICTRGDRDYPLQENLKFWRYRMYLLPKEHPAVKKITETFPSIHCDIFAETKMDSKQVDEFLRFVELYLNKFKQPATNKQLKEISTVQKSHLTQRRHSTSIIMRPSPNQAIGNSPFRDRLGSNRLPEKRPRSGTKHIEKGPGRISPAAEAAGLNINHVDANNLMSASTTEDKDEIVIPEVKLNQNATLTEIFDAMRHPINGVSFCGKIPSLPTFTFVSSDAINWLISHIDSPSINPIEILESMRCARMICHASGDFSKPIKSGFHLYYISAQDRESKDYTPPLGDFDAFENEWMEVEIKYADQLQNKKNSNFECNIPQFLREHVEINRIDGPLYKQVHLDTDIQLKSDRTEWGHLRYHRIMTPGYAYEIIVQWLIASGSILNDLIFAWCCRKAPHCGFQLIPIPADPLAEPFTDKSDPLRGPIFIPLHLDCLKQHRDFLFEEFKKDSWPDRLLLFQEAIVHRFGFLPCYVETKIGSNQSSFDHQYVHCTGHMFILVPSPHQGLKIRQRLASGGTMKKPTFINKVTQPNLHAESHSHDSRHTNCKAKDDLEIATPRKIGFLWSWNHMISNKKWKSLIVNNSADGELFQLRMLRDFKDFCTNQDNRLVNYWDECWVAKEKASIKDAIL